MSDKLYKIIRLFQDQDKPNEVILEGLTLEAARLHCQRYDSEGKDWFDGYVQMPDVADDTKVTIRKDEIVLVEVLYTSFYNLNPFEAKQFRMMDDPADKDEYLCYADSFDETDEILACRDTVSLEFTEV